MTPRPRAGLRLALALGLLSLAGCDPRQVLYFIQPFDPKVAAPGPNLREKRVVIICKAVPGSLYDYPTLDRELGRELARIFRAQVKKIDVVDPAMVEAWDQAHPSWTDPAELAGAFDADYVVFCEINQFQIQDPSSPGLFEGHSAIHVRAVERAYPKDDRGRPLTGKPKEARIAYEGDRETSFPVRGPLPASAEVTPTIFKAKFLRLVANEISWHFVAHKPGDNIQDVSFAEQ